MQDQETREALNTLLDSITDKVRSAPEPEREALLGGAMTMLRDMAVQQGLDDGQAGGWAAEIEQEVRQRLAQREPGSADQTVQ